MRLNYSNYPTRSLDFSHPFKLDARSVVSENLGEPDFGPSEFASEIGMSRMHLHRMLLKHFGMNTSAFIRYRRLEKAAGLLKRSQMSITEIAFETGFSNLSYFARCFREFAGKTPSTFRNDFLRAS